MQEFTHTEVKVNIKMYRTLYTDSWAGGGVIYEQSQM
jgi:hypothetical protein